jgi:hypothetical protein
MPRILSNSPGAVAARRYRWRKKYGLNGMSGLTFVKRDALHCDEGRLNRPNGGPEDDFTKTTS